MCGTPVAATMLRVHSHVSASIRQRCGFGCRAQCELQISAGFLSGLLLPVAVEGFAFGAPRIARQLAELGRTGRGSKLQQNTTSASPTKHACRYTCKKAIN